MLKLKVSVAGDPDIALGIKEEERVSIEAEPVMREELATSDYEKLRNKPRLNGVEIIGDVEETDPTVPGWAKARDKPRYTAEEVGGLDVEGALTLEEIDQLFNMV